MRLLQNFILFFGIPALFCRACRTHFVQMSCTRLLLRAFDTFLRQLPQSFRLQPNGCALKDFRCFLELYSNALKYKSSLAGVNLTSSSTCAPARPVRPVRLRLRDACVQRRLSSKQFLILGLSTFCPADGPKGRRIADAPWESPRSFSRVQNSLRSDMLHARQTKGVCRSRRWISFAHRRART